MPGTTSLGVSYPCAGEAITLATLQGFSNSVESALVATNTIATDALYPDAVRLYTLNQTLTANVTAAASWFAAEYDRGGLWNPGSPTIVTIQSPGTYMIGAEVDISSPPTLTAMRMAILVNGVEKAVEKSQSNTSPWISGELHVTYLAPVLTAGTQITVNLLYTGTGTDNSNSNLTVTQVGNS